MARGNDYITLARQHAKAIWDATNALKAMQDEWNAQDYGTTLADGTGENDGYTADEVGSVVFATTDALKTLYATGHATNLTNLL